MLLIFVMHPDYGVLYRDFYTEEEAQDFAARHTDVIVMSLTDDEFYGED